MCRTYREWVTDGSLALVADGEAAASLLDPARRAILEQLQEAGSAASVARRLNLPRQRVRYHVRELERQGLVKPAGQRRRGNCTEKLVRATARRYVLSPAVTGGLAPEPGDGDRLSAAYLVGVTSRAASEVTALHARAQREGKRLATFTIDSEIRFATPERQQAFAQELAYTLGRLGAKYHDEATPGGRRFRVLVAGHPAPAPTSRTQTKGDA